MTKPRNDKTPLEESRQGQALRRQAEVIIAQGNQKHDNPSLVHYATNDVQQLIQELQVHQIELEMQNNELRKTQIELDRERERYFDLYNLAPVGYLSISAGGLILEANLTAARMLGVTRADLIMQPMTQFIYTEDQDVYYLYRKKFFCSQENQSCELRLMDKNHYHRWASLIAQTLQDSKGSHIVRLILIDINEQKVYENELNRIAQHDALTNLPNRVLLSDRLQQGMTRAKRNGLYLAVVYLDLDGFKEVNDSHGHETGDQVLIAIAHRMTEVLRDGDTIARLGGDEFVAILHDIIKIENVIPLLTRFLETIAQPILVDDLSLQISASLGVSFYPQMTEVDTDVLLRQADQAMYQAKLAGRNRYHFFDAVQDSALREHYEMIERIKQALNACEFELYYQPKVNMKTSEVIGVEALIRWQHPDRGLLQPAEFLPIIEEHELSVRLGDWVMDQALSQMEQWLEEGLTINVSVNVTARQLKDTLFIASLKHKLAAHPTINPIHFELEVLETSKLDNIDHTADIMEASKLMGVHFSLDDFGTGYSSLAYLQRLPINTIKIDQSFIRDMLHNPDSLNILSAIMGLASAFRKNVIAEGVETIEHGEQLLAMNCELAQGYAISRPMTAKELPHWLHTWQSPVQWISNSHNRLQ